MKISFTTKQCPDRWATWSEDFGFFAYGTTELESKAKALQALSALISSFDTIEELQAYLVRKKVS